MRSSVFVPVHRKGECDDCHVDGEELFAFDEDKPGGWEYCRGCIERFARIRERRNRILYSRSA